MIAEPPFHRFGIETEADRFCGVPHSEFTRGKWWMKSTFWMHSKANIRGLAFAEAQTGGTHQVLFFRGGAASSYLQHHCE